MYTIAIAAPLLGAILVGLFKKGLGKKGSQLITCGCMTLATLIGFVIFKEVALEGNRLTIPLFEWIRVEEFKVMWALRFDTLSAVMIVVVTLISTLVHFYSIGYMDHDPAGSRFMGYLSLFTFFMLMLVTSDNFIQLFLGWEGVGLASYLLIGFWNDRPAANAAAMKAFIVNRVGDIGLALGVCAIFSLFHSVHFDTVFRAVPAVSEATQIIGGIEFHSLSLICGLLFIGAMGKSAQLGLHVWLPDAMEGPTPVSALIHAATMVTAGVFMVARLSPLFEHAPFILEFMAILGATTAFFAATIAMTQNDIKRVIAYSTCSQLGYMFLAAGVSAYGASIFHLFTHAFFKALLFLGAGSVIHAMSDEQNLQRMGGIYKMIPFTYGAMWVGTLALVGAPFFAGYYSKDWILEAAWAAGTPGARYGFVLGILTVFLTAFYSARLLFLAFHGSTREEEKVLAHVHESPFSMLLPLGLLALGAAGSGFFFIHLFEEENFWGSALLVLPDHMKNLQSLPKWVSILPMIASFLGLGIAVWFYLIQPHIPQLFVKTFPKLHDFLYNKWYIDVLYERLWVRPLQRLGIFCYKGIDQDLIDEGGPKNIMRLVDRWSVILSHFQNGYIARYALVMVGGVIGLLFMGLWVGRLR